MFTWNHSGGTLPRFQPAGLCLQTRKSDPVGLGGSAGVALGFLKLCPRWRWDDTSRLPDAQRKCQLHNRLDEPRKTVLTVCTRGRCLIPRVLHLRYEIIRHRRFMKSSEQLLEEVTNSVAWSRCLVYSCFIFQEVSVIMSSFQMNIEPWIAWISNSNKEWCLLGCYVVWLL
jgi:hypothetical protein